MKKAQIKMMESILVLIIFLVLLTFGFVFYAKVSGHSREQKYLDKARGDNFQTALRIYYLPEMHCTTGGVKDVSCVDYHKLLFFKDVVEANKDYYQKVIGNVEINLTIVFPIQAGIKIYDNPLTVTRYAASKRYYYMPVMMVNSTQDTGRNSMYKYIGYLTIGVYY